MLGPGHSLTRPQVHLFPTGGADNPMDNCSAKPITGGGRLYMKITTSASDTANASAASVTIKDKTTPALPDSSLTVNGCIGRHVSEFFLPESARATTV
jgi:hypothetical protein